MHRQEPINRWAWPGGAKIAVSIGLAFEGFENVSQFKTYNSEQKKNFFSLSFADYAWKAGAWRLMELLDGYGITGQCYTNGLAAEKHPEVVAALARAGHEIVGHGWINDPDRPTNELDPDAERLEIQRCTKALTEAAGQRPVGWVSPGYTGTKSTLHLLQSEGYLWSGDDASHDLPFIERTPNGRMVILPVTGYASNDLGMWIGPRNPPGVIWEGFKDTFDCLYEEGRTGAPGWTEIVLHCHIAGRPTLIPTIRKCLDYARRHEDVWFARRRDMAEWTLQRETA
jgi:peptidoglycan/xylan/chitin deacetylase (PgdA/CDA1 family)